LTYTLPLLAQTGRCLRAHLRTQTHAATISSLSMEIWHSLPAPQYFTRHGSSSERENIAFSLTSSPLLRDTLRDMFGIAIRNLGYAADTRMFAVSRMLQACAIDDGILYVRKRNILCHEYTRPFTIKLPIILNNATVLSCCNKSLCAIPLDRNLRILL